MTQYDFYATALTGGITFLPAVQGMDSDEDARQAVENARAQIVKIEQARKIEKQTATAILCSFKYDEAMQVLTRKSEEFKKIKDEYRKIVSTWPVDPSKFQQFRGTHPGYVDIINTVIKPSGWDPKKMILFVGYYLLIPY